MGHVLEMEPFRRKRAGGKGSSVYEICLLKHVPGKGLLILQDEAESAISDVEVRLLFGQAAIDLTASKPDEWCAIVTDDEDGARREASGQKRRPGSTVSHSGRMRALRLSWPRAGVVLKERKPLPFLTPVSGRATERMLLELLDAGLADSDYISTLTKLAYFYSCVQNGRLAASVTRIVLEYTDDAQTRAAAYLRLGQLAEQDDQMQLAHQYYLEGLAIGPRDKGVAYLLHNNTGYCLNALGGRSEEAERYCRLAIEIDPDRYNAYKNLGISLERRGDPEGAARAYIDSTRAEPGDSRAFHLLRQLLANHPEVGARFPGVIRELEDYRRAAETGPER